MLEASPLFRKSRIKKTHFSIRRKNTSGINIPIMPKIGKGPKEILQSELFLTQKVYIRI
jgi:hypothetical protein